MTLQDRRRSTWSNETEHMGGQGRARKGKGGWAFVAARASVGRRQGRETARSAWAGRVRARRQPPAPPRWSSETERCAAGRAGKGCAGRWLRGGRTRWSESPTPGSTDAAPLPSRRHCESGTGTGDVARSAQSTWTNETEHGGGHGKGRGRAVVAARASVGRAWAAEAGKGTARSARAGRLRARRQPQAPSRWSNETEQSAAARAGRAASGGG